MSNKSSLDIGCSELRKNGWLIFPKILSNVFKSSIMIICFFSYTAHDVKSYCHPFVLIICCISLPLTYRCKKSRLLIFCFKASDFTMEK